MIGQTSNLAINPTLYTKLPYDPVADLTPIGLIGNSPLLFTTVQNYDSTTANGLTPLMLAARNGHYDAVMKLLGAGSLDELSPAMVTQLQSLTPVALGARTIFRGLARLLLALPRGYGFGFAGGSSTPSTGTPSTFGIENPSSFATVGAMSIWRSFYN